MKKFKKHVASEEEKKLIGYLTKKKKVKRINVYFNRLIVLIDFMYIFWHAFLVQAYHYNYIFLIYLNLSNSLY